MVCFSSTLALLLVLGCLVTLGSSWLSQTSGTVDSTQRQAYCPHPINYKLET